MKDDDKRGEKKQMMMMESGVKKKRNETKEIVTGREEMENWETKKGK